MKSGHRWTYGPDKTISHLVREESSQRILVKELLYRNLFVNMHRKLSIKMSPFLISQKQYTALQKASDEKLSIYRIEFFR